MSEVTRLIHEMRNSAAIVVNFAELLSGEIGTDEAKQDLDAIRRAGERLGELCSELQEALEPPQR